jgi:hypothetical protein
VVERVSNAAVDFRVAFGAWDDVLGCNNQNKTLVQSALTTSCYYIRTNIIETLSAIIFPQSVAYATVWTRTSSVKTISQLTRARAKKKNATDSLHPHLGSFATLGQRDRRLTIFLVRLK